MSEIFIFKQKAFTYFPPCFPVPVGIWYTEDVPECVHNNLRKFHHSRMNDIWSKHCFFFNLLDIFSCLFTKNGKNNIEFSDIRTYHSKELYMVSAILKNKKNYIFSIIRTSRIKIFRINFILSLKQAQVFSRNYIEFPSS